MSTHIKNDAVFAKTVLMPGDPLRAKYIAENFLTDYHLVNTVRGMTAYTGYYKDVLVTIFPSGMGIPSMGIYSYELFKFYDVDNIIRVGSAGALTDKIKLKSVLLAEKVYSKSNYAKIQNGSDDIVLSSSEILNDQIISTARENNINVLKSVVYCSDAFYNETEKPNILFDEYGCSAVEMESFALFHNARVLNKRATCILTISDNLVTKEKLSAMERQTGFDEMIKLALNSTLKM